MIINGIEFDFSTLNANDVDRMLAAQAKQQERARMEGSRYTPESDYPAWLRFQCRIFMDYLDEVLGEGASEKLGLDGSNFNACLTVSKAFAEAMVAEKDSASALIHPTKERGQVSAAQAIPAPMNRQQRRAAARTQAAVSRAQEAADAARTQAAVSRAQEAADAALPPAVQMVQRVDKAARRRELLAQLAELEEPDRD